MTRDFDGWQVKGYRRVGTYNDSLIESLERNVYGLAERLTKLEDKFETRLRNVEEVVSLRKGGELLPNGHTVSNVHDQIIDTQNRVEKLEELTDDHEGRITTLITSFVKRIKKLESEYNESSLVGHSYRLKILEKWKDIHIESNHRDVLKPWIDGLANRISKVEEWQNGFKEDVITSFANRLDKLEEWKKWEVTTHITGQRIVNETTDNRIKALEEWKDSKSGMNFYDSMFSALQKQIKELLEWKQVTESLDYGKFLAWQHTALVGGWKAVDKSAWEQIRKFLDDIFKSVPMSPGRIEYTKKLVEKQDK